MAIPPASDPDNPGALSPREKEILATIEADLTTTDPALAARMAHPDTSAVRAWPSSARSVLLITMLVILMLIVLLTLASGLDHPGRAVGGHTEGAHQQVARTCPALQPRRFPTARACALRR